MATWLAVLVLLSAGTRESTPVKLWRCGCTAAVGRDDIHGTSARNVVQPASFVGSITLNPPLAIRSVGTSGCILSASPCTILEANQQRTWKAEGDDQLQHNNAALIGSFILCGVVQLHIPRHQNCWKQPNLVFFASWKQHQKLQKE
jgi:hypothetical protein